MRIAIFSDLFLPAIDGIVTSLEQLIIELARQNHQVLLVVPQAEGAPKKIHENVEIVYLPSIPVVLHPTWHFGILSPRLLKTFKDFNPEVVQVATPANVGLMGIFLAKQHKVPVVGVFHTYFMKPEYLHWVVVKQGVKIVEQIGWKLMQLVFKPCEAIISPAESVKKDLIDHGISNPLVVCNNGLFVDETLFDKKMHAEFLKKNQLDPNQTLLYIGRLSKEKNLSTLLKMFYGLLVKKPESKLLIVGDGPMRSELETLIRLYDMQEQVLLTGEVQHDDIFRYGFFQMAKVFVTCSTSEVQPMSVIEALFHGVPVVAYRSQGMTDLIESGKNGFLIEPDSEEEFVSQVEKVMTDQKLFLAMSKRARKKAAMFSSKNSALAHLKVFRQVIRSKKVA